MADTLKTQDLTQTPMTDSTKDLQSIGISRDIQEFDVSKTYEYMDRIKVTSSGVARYYIFLKHHDPGTLSDSDVRQLSTPELSSTLKTDMSFITDKLNMIEDMSKTTGYSFSGNNLGNAVDFVVYVKGFDSAFDVSDRLVKAVDEDNVTITGRTDSEGKCVLTFDRTKTYAIETQIINGYSSTSVQGRRYTVGPRALNQEYKLPNEFCEEFATNENYGYYAGDTVSYDGKCYKFNSNHTTAWTGTDVTEIDYPKRQATFTYKKDVDIDEKVTFTLKMQYEGGIPISSYSMGVFAGEENAFNPDASLASGEIYDGNADVGNVKGELSVKIAKDKFCEVVFPPLDCHNLPEKLYYHTISDNDKTITQTYDSGIKWVCGETEASIKDGTAWKEFSIDEFPFDPESEWNGTTEGYAKTVSNVKYYHPFNHPLALIHVATNELVNVQFDHTSQELMDANDGSNGISAPSTAQKQKFEHNKKPYNASYYIRPEDLTTERSSEVTQGRQWCNYNLLHKDVTTSTSKSVLSSYDGPWMTSMIKYDSDNWLLSTYTDPSDSTKTLSAYMNGTSPAAEYALSSTFEFGRDGTPERRTLHGFIGTYTQMNPLFNLSQAIYGGLKKFGYLANFKTGTYWWSATQQSGNNAAAVAYFYSGFNQRYKTDKFGYCLFC